MKISFTTWLMAGLLLAVTLLAVIMACQGAATWLEAASFVTGAACVWLTVKESLWNFPISLINVATFSVVYFNSRLFADASLQVVYFVLTVIGWWLWVRGGERRTALKIGRLKGVGMLMMMLSIALMTLVFWRTLKLVGGSASFWDAFTTALSLGAQWLLNKKKLENWILWIIADVFYIPLYLYKGLLLTSILYAVFLVMATAGYLQWRRTWRLEKESNKTELQPVESAA